MRPFNNIKISIICLAALFLPLTGASAAQIYNELRGDYDASSGIDNYKPHTQVVTTIDSEKKAGKESEELQKVRALTKKWYESLNARPFDIADGEGGMDSQSEYGDYEKVRALLKGKLSFDRLSVIALYRNPMILAAKSRWRAAIERFSQIQNLDMIMQDYVSFTKSLSTKVGPPKNKQMIGMKFPFPGMLSLKGEIVDKDVSIAKLDYDNTRLKIHAMLMAVYHNLLFTSQEELITKDTLKLLKDLEVVAQIKYETGKTSFNDVLKVQIKIDRFYDRLTTITERKDKLRVKLTQIIDMPPDTELGELVYMKNVFTKSLEELYDTGRADNIELAIFDEKIKRMSLMIDMAKKKFYPDFTLGYSYFQDNKVMQTGTQAMMPAFMTAPMTMHRKDSWYAKNDAYIREVMEKYDAMLNMREAKVDKLISDIRDTYFKIDKAQREERLYESNLLFKAKEALDVARVGYETGRVSFLDVLDADTMWLNFNIKHYKAKKDISVNIANIEKLLGSYFSPDQEGGK